jgi:DNA polymerase Ligase (LigD)
MSRYVILEHDHPVLHWDFMLEFGPLLRTWRLASQPTAGQVIAAAALGEHRLAYLDYEGPVSGNRGTVRQWDRGEFEPVEETDERVVVRLQGRRLNGTATLEHAGAVWWWRWTAE